MAIRTKHERAREQSLHWMVDAVERHDYLDALQWLTALAAADDPFVTITTDDLVAHWRERAGRARHGRRPRFRTAATEAADYRGIFHALMRHTYEGIVLCAVEDDWILECSDSFCAMTGFARQELLGRTSAELGILDPGVRAARPNGLSTPGPAAVAEVPLHRKDGRTRWCEVAPLVPIEDELVLTIVRDVTDRHQSQEHIRELADRDPLTGLFNRRRFREEVERRLVEARRHADALSLMLVDLDGLKTINDRHGHQTGDDALVAVARALQAVVRETDVLARLGGDEFAILLVRAEANAAARVAAAFAQRLRRSPLPHPDGDIPLRASVGTAHALQGRFDFDRLVNSADRAMYQNKRVRR